MKSSQSISEIRRGYIYAAARYSALADPRCSLYYYKQRKCTILHLLPDEIIHNCSNVSCLNNTRVYRRITRWINNVVLNTRTYINSFVCSKTITHRFQNDCKYTGVSEQHAVFIVRIFFTRKTQYVIITLYTRVCQIMKSPRARYEKKITIVHHLESVGIEKYVNRLFTVWKLFKGSIKS